MSMLLICGMQTALGQGPRVLLGGGCGSERTTDIDGGSASSTSGDPCLVLGLSSPQQTTVIIFSPTFPYLHQSKPPSAMQDSFGDFAGSFVQPYWWTSHDDQSSAKNQRLLLATATRIMIPAEMNVTGRQSFRAVCVRHITVREEIDEFRVLIYRNSMPAVGPGSNALCNRSWA